MTDPKWYDMTLSKAKIDFRTILDLFDEVADRFVIGEEVGKETGYEHWQIRVVFKNGRSWEQMKRIYGQYGCVTPSHVRNFDYCEKEGRFYRSWEGPLRGYAFAQLLPWQEQCVDLYMSQGERNIMVVIDEGGNIGKSFLRKFLQVTHKGNYIPPMNDYKDLMRICMAKTGQGYIFDLPRADDINKKKGMWMTIETIKDGYLFDDRYKFVDRWIEPPKILVFTNDEPPWDALSKDRWEAYTVEGTDKYRVLMPWSISDEGVMYRD